MFQDKPLLVCGLFDVNRNDRDARYPSGKIQHHGDVMVEQNRRQTVPAPEPDLVMEKRGRPLDHCAELGVAVCAVELSIVVVVGQKQPADQRPIVDTGLEEIRKRTPWECGRAFVHLSGLRDMFSYSDQGGHSPSSSAP
jgi:hypothetical protein